MPDTNHLADVPDGELGHAIRYCDERIAEARANGLSIPQLARQIGVGASALKQLAKRAEGDLDASLRRGAVFTAVYEYFKSEESSRSRVSVDQIEDIIKYFSKFDEKMQKNAAYSLLMYMIRVNPLSQERAASKTFRRLYCFRNAVNPAFIIKSRIEFENLFEGDRDHPGVWEFDHSYVDNNGIEKSSDGVAFVINNNIYMLGDVQKGEGLEMMILREALDEPDFMIGFHVSTDDHRPFFANMVFFDADNFDRIERGAPAPTGENSSARESTGIYSKDVVLKGLLLKSPKLGEGLINQLKIPDSDSVLRIDQRFMIPTFEKVREETGLV